MEDKRPDRLSWWCGPSKEGAEVGIDTSDRAEWLRRLAIANARWLAAETRSEKFNKEPTREERGLTKET